MLAMREQIYAMRDCRLGGSDYARGAVNTLLKAACDSLIAAAMITDRETAIAATEQK
jgi:hypothetical protein